MKKDKTLLIMAAGLGTRFGGFKQLEKIGPHDEYIIDYSIYDAIKSGFTKVVFIIKEEIYDKFKETIGSRIEPFIKVEYVFQNMDYIPTKYKNIVKKSQQAMTARALVAAWRHSTENRMDSPSQKQIYTLVNARNTRILPISSRLGGIPVTRRPMAPTIPPMTKIMIKIIAEPAKNFPLITLSR